MNEWHATIRAEGVFHSKTLGLGPSEEIRVWRTVSRDRTEVITGFNHGIAETTIVAEGERVESLYFPLGAAQAIAEAVTVVDMKPSDDTRGEVIA